MRAIPGLHRILAAVCVAERGRTMQHTIMPSVQGMGGSASRKRSF